MKKILFGNDEFYQHPYPDNPQDGFTTERVAETVWSDFIEQDHPMTYDEVVEACSSIVHIDFDDPKYRIKTKGSKNWDINWELHDADVREASKKEADKIIDQYKGKFFYKFRYSDEDGTYGCALEHGGLFNKLPHIVISEH